MALSVVFNVSVNLLFYSTQGLVYLPVVFFVFASDFADERNDHSETATDASNHNLSFHVITKARRLVPRLSNPNA